VALAEDWDTRFRTLRQVLGPKVTVAGYPGTGKSLEENYWLFPSPWRARLHIRRNKKTRYASIGHARMNDPCPRPHVLKTAQFFASNTRARGIIRKNPSTVAMTPFNTPLFIFKLH